MDIVTIDFETYYSREFSLSKMTTEEYIRHPDFEVIGVGIKRVGDEGSGAWYTGDDVGPALHQLNLHKCAVLAHHAAFDGAILSWKYGIQPAFWLDTLSMSRPIHGTNVGGSLKALADHYQIGAKGTEVVDAMGKRLADFTPQELHQYGRYCINDVELTIKLLAILRPFIPPGELRVIDLLIRCYTEPVIELDVPLLEQHLQNTRDGKSSLLKALTKDGDESKLKDILMSNDKFAALLQALRVVPPTKISQRTGKEAWAFSKTDAEFTALLEHPNPKVQAAVAARLGTKSTIEETRTQNLLGVASRGRLPIMLNYWGAHTGRLSGGDGMNLQNLPSRGNTTIRRALRAPEGYAVIACDSSQIEARIVAWLAGQDDLVQAFREGRDIYSEFATDVYGRLITKSDKTERFVGKTCILGLGYGMGAAKLQRTLELGMAGISVKLELGEAERIVRLYRQKYHKIPMLWRQCDNALAGIASANPGAIRGVVPYDARGVRLPNGIYLTYAELRSSPNGYEYIGERRELAKFKRGEPAEFDKIYGGKLTENVVQGLAAQVIREQMVNAVNAKMKIVLQVHDEIVVAVPEESGEAMEAKLVEIMSTPPKWAAGLPVACEAGRADNYGDT
jgi:DNA polymerase